MPRTHIMVLNAGGLRSLVASALARQEPGEPWLSLLHIDDGRANVRPRLDHVRLQAEWLGIKSVRQLRLPHLYHEDHGHDEQSRPLGPLARPQLLLAAMVQARLTKVARIVLPVSANGNEDDAMRLAEQVDLVRQLAETEPASPAIEIDTPLLDMTDAQVLQLGDQLDAPWHAAWSCLHRLEAPCQSCAACKRRMKAFDAAGLIDTQRHAVAAR